MTQLQTEWGWLVAIYLFLGGLGAGAMVTSAVLALATGERFRSTVRFAAWASAVVIALGTACLLFDVGRPLRALVLFRSFVRFNSWMAIGAWLLFAAIVVNGLIALLHTDALLSWLRKRWQRIAVWRPIVQIILLIVAIPLNLGVAVYTGMLLSSLLFRPFWHTLLLPALFTASALNTGLALVTAYASLRERSRRLRLVLELAAFVLIVLEGAALLNFVRAGLAGSVDTVRSAELLLRGALGFPFWAMVVGFGLAVPLLMCLVQLSGLTRRVPVLAPLIGATSCLAGGFTLRMVVLMAGLPVMLTTPEITQFMAGARFLP